MTFPDSVAEDAGQLDELRRTADSLVENIGALQSALDSIDALRKERAALRDALADLVALYAAVPGHDPAFVRKSKAALGRECVT